MPRYSLTFGDALKNYRDYPERNIDAAERQKIRASQTLYATRQRKFHDGNNTVNGHNVATIGIPESVLADRDARLAMEPQSITAALMGDPPPGRSALDKRQIRLVRSNA